MSVRLFASDERDPYARGVAIGEFGAASIRENLAGYERLFQSVGMAPDRLPPLGTAAVEHVTAWSPALDAELRGIAAGARLEMWQLGVLNARTEILAVAEAVGEGECSTSVYLPPAGAPRTLQTWDWHDSICADTLLLRYPSPSARTVRCFTEFGVLGKIGINDAGLGLHFNILNHRSDGHGMGVPVHVVARRVLDEATSIEEAVSIAGSAAVSTSTLLTMVSYDGAVADAACIELSPRGMAVVRPDDDGHLLHTNHFLDPGLARDEGALESATTYPRFSHLCANKAALAEDDPVRRVGALVSHAPDGAPTCRHPDTSLPLHLRWETLLTVGFDLDTGRLQYHGGGPCQVTADTWLEF